MPLLQNLEIPNATLLMQLASDTVWGYYLSQIPLAPWGCPACGAQEAGLLDPQPKPAAEPSLALETNKICQLFELSDKWDGAVFPHPSSQLGF